MKTTNQSAIGTSFHDTYLTTTVNKLIAAIGEPKYVQNNGSDKVNFEWCLETDNGNVFTIYDWKEYRPIELDEEIEFHIGGKSASITNQVLLEINQALKK